MFEHRYVALGDREHGGPSSAVLGPGGLASFGDLPAHQLDQLKVDVGARPIDAPRYADDSALLEIVGPFVGAAKPVVARDGEVAAVAEADSPQRLADVLAVEPDDRRGDDLAVLVKRAGQWLLERLRPPAVPIELGCGRIALPRVLRADQAAGKEDQVVGTDALTRALAADQERAVLAIGGVDQHLRILGTQHRVQVLGPRDSHFVCGSRRGGHVVLAVAPTAA